MTSQIIEANIEALRNALESLRLIFPDVQIFAATKDAKGNRVTYQTGDGDKYALCWQIQLWLSEQANEDEENG